MGTSNVYLVNEDLAWTDSTTRKNLQNTTEKS